LISNTALHITLLSYCITIIITLEGIEKIKTEKRKGQQKSLKNISYTKAVTKGQQTL